MHRSEVVIGLEEELKEGMKLSQDNTVVPLQASLLTREKLYRIIVISEIGYRA